MKKAVSLIMLLTLLLTSCSRYLKIEFNKYTRVYLPGISYSSVEDSFDIYSYSLHRYFRAGSRTYLFDESYLDANGKHPPSLAYMEKGKNTLSYVCTDPECVHNDRLNFTKRCVLCDISDYKYTAFNNGTLYFARANRDNGAGGFYYDCSDGTDLSETDTETFVLQEFWENTDEHEVPWEIISYDLESGEEFVLYSVPAESYLDRVVYLDGKLYFVETYYAERPDLINTSDDSEWFYFTSEKTGEQTEKRRARHFYTHLTFRREKTDYYTKLYSDNPNKIPANTGGFLINIRDNRKFKLGDQKQLFEKVYDIKSLDLKTNEVKTLVSEAESEPQELLAWGGALYVADKLGIYKLELSSGSSLSLLKYESQDINYTDVSSLQFDQYANRLYFKRGNMIDFIRIYDDRGVHDMVFPFRGITSEYQLADGGVYFLTLDGSIYFIRWNEIFNENKYKTVYDSNNGELPAESLTVIEDFAYISILGDEDYKYYDHYKLQLAVNITDYEEVEDLDTPGAGINDYELTVTVIPIFKNRAASQETS